MLTETRHARAVRLVYADRVGNSRSDYSDRADRHGPALAETATPRIARAAESSGSRCKYDVRLCELQIGYIDFGIADEDSTDFQFCEAVNTRGQHRAGSVVERDSPVSGKHWFAETECPRHARRKVGELRTRGDDSHNPFVV